VGCPCTKGTREKIKYQRRKGFEKKSKGKKTNQERSPAVPACAKHASARGYKGDVSGGKITLLKENNLE